MSNTEESFREGYGKLVSSIWADPALAEQLKSAPVDTLKAYGIDVADGADIRVVEVKQTGRGDFEEQWEDWQKGDEDGTYDLWIPSKPATSGSSAAQDVSTTCTPCSTCT